MDRVGVIHGRFQMLHKGHMEYLLAGKERCEHLIIGICNPDISMTKYDEASPHRSETLSNPLTYFERYEMIKGSLIEDGILMKEFDIVPFPINFPERIFNYAPVEAKYYMTIYDEWGKKKKKILESIGCDVDVMWRRTDSQRITSGTEVRERIRNGIEWKELVPDFVYRYVVDNGIDSRIRQVGFTNENC